jgi:hypothetical protein
VMPGKRAETINKRTENDAFGTLVTAHKAWRNIASCDAQVIAHIKKVKMLQNRRSQLLIMLE